MKIDFYIGFDGREGLSYHVCKHSIVEHVTHNRIYGIELEQMREHGYYIREHKREGNQLYDVISEAPMSTEFAISRFLVPRLAGYQGYAVFMDSDMMFVSDVTPLLVKAVQEQPGKPLYCVKHNHVPDYQVKMDGQIQTQYKCKNWSSFMLFDCSHPANFDIEYIINTVPGRDLHRFCWLSSDEIGELPSECNYLVNHTVLPDGVEPVNIHWTDGSPEILGQGVQYSDLWYRMIRKSARIR